MVDIATRTSVHDTPGTLRAPPVPIAREGVVRRVAWGAIVAGAAVATGCQLIFTMLGAGIGLAAIRPATGNDPGTGMAIGAGIWWLITGLISLFVGGMVTGRLAGLPRKIDALLHGVLMWCATAILGAWLVTSSAASLISGAFGPVAHGYAGAAANNPSVNGRERRGNDASTASPSNSFSASGDITPRQPVVQERAGETVIRDPVSGGQITESEARVAADKAARALSVASLWSFFALLLGICAAGLGATKSRPLAARGEPAWQDSISDPVVGVTLPERRPPD